MYLQKLFESVYVGLCLKLGTPQQVAIRREVKDTAELVDKKFVQENLIDWYLYLVEVKERVSDFKIPTLT